MRLPAMRMPLLPSFGLFRNMSIAKRLPIMIAAICFSVTAVTTIHGYIQGSKLVTQSTVSQFEQMVVDREKALTAYLSETEAEIERLAQSPTVLDAQRRLTFGYSTITGDRTAYLQKWYIDENPNEIGKKDVLDVAADRSTYSSVHETLHPSMRAFLRQRGLYDLFLFDPKGNLIYSVYKERDYATNFRDGPFADSGLGRAFELAMSSEEPAAQFVDYAPYAPSNGAAAAFVSVRMVRDNGNPLGVLAFQIPSDAVSQLLNDVPALGETGDIFLVSEDLTSRSASRHEGRLDLLAQVPPSNHVRTAFTAEPSVLMDATGLQGNAVIAATIPVDFEHFNWALVAERDQAEAFQDVIAMRNVLILELGVVVAIVAVLGWLMARSLTSRIARMDKAVEAIAMEQYDKEIPELDTSDEIGAIATNLDRLKTKLIAGAKADLALVEAQAEQTDVVERLKLGLNQLSAGDLTSEISEPFSEKYEELRNDFNSSVTRLANVVGDIVLNTDDITGSAAEISQSSGDLSHRTEEQAVTLQATASSISQLVGSVEQGAQDAKQAAKVVSDAKQNAEDSGTVLKSTIEAMGEIKTSSDAISEIILVIDDIAFQTNLLALNAAVEAARAGDVGKGFAVVATEVRALAQRSAEAAKEIKSLIGESADHVNKGVSLVDKTGASLTGIVEQVAHISDLVTSIADGASEQSSSLGQINSGVNQLDNVTQLNAAMAEEVTAAAMLLDKGAHTLSEVVAQFKIKARGPDLSDTQQKWLSDEDAVPTEPKPEPLLLDEAAQVTLGRAVGAELEPAPAPAPAPTAKTALDNEGVWKDF